MNKTGMSIAIEAGRPSHVKVATASLIGTAIEWYDFFLYGTAAALIFNKLFFPTFDPGVGTLLAFATFALGFVARPLGGNVFGHFGDRIGRTIRQSRPPARVHIWRDLLRDNVLPPVLAARHEKPAARLDRDRSRPRRRSCRHVRPTGELLRRIVRDQGALQRRVARLQSRINLCRRAVADHRHLAHDRLQAADLADLSLHDYSGAHYCGVGVLRVGNTQIRGNLSGRSVIVLRPGGDDMVDHPALPFLKRNEKGKVVSAADAVRKK